MWNLKKPNTEKQGRAPKSQGQQELWNLYLLDLNFALLAMHRRWSEMEVGGKEDTQSYVNMEW